MKSNRRFFVRITIASLLLVVAFFADLLLGSVYIPVSDTLNILRGKEVDEALRYIILDFRLPKALTADLCRCRAFGSRFAHANAFS
jgi:iron complex transport system permease protein